MDNLRRKYLNAVVYSASIFMALIGIFLVIISAYLEAPTWKSILRDIGSILVVSATVTLLIEYWAKKKFMDELLEHIGISKEVSYAGIVEIKQSFGDIEVAEWRGLLQNVKNLDILFSYGRTWSEHNLEHLRHAVKRSDVRIRLVLPDPGHDAAINELANRFSYSPEELRTYINGTITRFSELRDKALESGAIVEIWLLPMAPVYSFYIFDNRAIFALFNHSREKDPVPAFVCEKGGFLYQFLSRELDAMIKEEGLAVRL